MPGILLCTVAFAFISTFGACLQMLHSSACLPAKAGPPHCVPIFMLGALLLFIFPEQISMIYCIIEDQKRYDVQVSDTTMLTIAAALLGQKEFLSKNRSHPQFLFFISEQKKDNTYLCTNNCTMQITNYSNFRKNLKTFMDNCVDNNDAIIINREENGSLVLLPLEKYKEIDETEYLLSQKLYASEVLKTFKAMKSKSTAILTPETYAKKYGK